MNKFFHRNTARWSDDALAGFMQERYTLMTSGPGNICTPAHSSVPKYAPFQSDGYAHSRLLGEFTSPSWRAAFNTDPYRLLHPNPFTLSGCRESKLGNTPAQSEYKFRCWDAAVAIPACGIRTPEPAPLNRIKASRHSNEQWRGASLPAIIKTGPLGHDGGLLRPRGQHIFDLTATDRDFAWDLLEMAHALAHQYDDIIPGSKNSIHIPGGAVRLRNALTEIVFAIMYGLPINVGLPTYRLSGTNTYFGTELITSRRFRDPALIVPWKTNEAPLPDTTLSMALGTVFIQPHPHGFTTSTHEFVPDDIWCCMPSMVALAGWEGIDFITHQAVGYNEYTSVRAGHYAVPADDLLTPESYWAYLALSQRTDRGDGLPVFTPPEDAVAHSMASIRRAEETEARLLNDSSKSVDEQSRDVRRAWEAERPGIQWVYPHEWIKTGHYRWLHNQTPPLPCKFCLDINSNAEGAPERPRGFTPKGPRKDWPEDHIRWNDDLITIRRIIRNAVVAYEVKRYGRKAARIRRRTCNAGARERYKRLRILEQAAAVKRNAGTARSSTPAQWDAYYLVQKGL